MRAIILLLLLVGSPAIGDEFRHYSQWTDEERAWFTTYAVASYIDYRQTAWALRQTGPSGQYLYSEANPILGRRPSSDSTAALKLGVLAAQYYSMGRLGFERENFRWGFKAATVVQVAVVINNDQLGISFTRAF